MIYDTIEKLHNMDLHLDDHVKKSNNLVQGVEVALKIAALTHEKEKRHANALLVDATFKETDPKVLKDYALNAMKNGENSKVIFCFFFRLCIHL